MKKIYMSVLISLLVIFICSPVSAQMQSASRKIYLVSNWQDYLRMVPISVYKQFTPLLYSPDGAVTEAIVAFANLYEGSVISLTSAEIDTYIETHWNTSETIILAQSQQSLAILAAMIASELHLPLYFGNISDTSLEKLHARNVIIVGAVVAPDIPVVMKLTTTGEAQKYYHELVARPSVTVLVNHDRMSFLAAEVAAYHRGNILFDVAEVTDTQSDYLIWVTNPENVTPKNVQSLYQAANVINTDDIYDIGIGVLTGYNAHDTALLVARTYAYSEMDGHWKNHFIHAESDATSKWQQTQDDMGSVVYVGGNELTTSRFSSLVQSASYVMVEAHGSPSGVLFSDGSWPNVQSRLQTPPLIFVAESCKTADLTTQHSNNSIALDVIAAGAVAYIGSMEIGGVGLVGNHPFAFSTPNIPLGEIVRMQNAARMELDADWPRAILIGDPTFHQFSQELINYTLVTESEASSPVHLQVSGQPFALPSVFVIPNSEKIVYAEVFTAEGSKKTYVVGGYHFDAPLSVAFRTNAQLVFLEWPGGDGDLLLYSKTPIWVVLRKFVSNGLIGIEGLYIDIMTQAGIDWLAFIISIILFWRSRPAEASPKLNAQKLWKGILVGCFFAAAAGFYCLFLNFTIPWLLLVATGLGATISIWIPQLDHPFAISPLCKSVFVFLLPLLGVWGIATVVGVSTHTHRLLASGLLLITSMYVIVAVAAGYLADGIMKKSNEHLRSVLS